MKNFSLTTFLILFYANIQSVSAQVLLEKNTFRPDLWQVATFSCSDSSLKQFTQQISNKVAYHHLEKNASFTSVNNSNVLDLLPLIGIDGYASYFLRTGDSATIRTVYPDIKTLLLAIEFDKKGLIKSPETPTPYQHVKKDADFQVLNNIWYYLALEGASSLAKVTDNEQDVAIYEYRRQEFKDVFHEQFWKGNGFVSNKNKTDERANALAIIAGLTTTAQDTVLHQLLLYQHGAMPYLEKYILEGLFKLHENEEAIRRIKEQVQTLIDTPSDSKLNQYTTSGHLSLLSDYVAGIRPLTAGFQKVIIQPRLGLLTKIDASLMTPQGKIQVSLAYNPTNNSIMMAVDLPATCKGIISLPILSDIYHYITCNHRLIFNNQYYTTHAITELDLVTGDERYLNFEVSKGGRYVFEGR